MLPGITEYAWLLFLPHGIRVLATSLLGWMAIPGLVAGSLIGNYMFWGLTDPTALLIVSMGCGSLPWLVFEGLKALNINAYYLKETAQPPNLQTLFAAATTASVANAFFITSVIEGTILYEHVTRVLAAFVAGDITGFLFVVMMAKVTMPLFRKKTD